MNNLNKYLNSRNSQEKSCSLLWLTSFGIQSVVNLKPSEDLFPIISRHIEGSIDIEYTRKELREFYHLKHKQNDDHHIHRSEEADKVAVRIVQYFLSNDFELSLEGFSKLHYQMFHGIYHNSGLLREKPLSKKEWVLGNTNVLYPSSDKIKEALEALFDVERHVNYSQMSKSHKMKRFCDFIAKLFVYNAFQYANSRTALVYAIKYLLSMGYQLRNDTMYREAWYFRNAIIRASYTNMHQGIYPTTEYMEMFLNNLLFDEDNELRNHRMVIRGE